MKLVIDIEDNLYIGIKKDKYHKGKLYKMIKNGKPLPKGHGRLIDAERLKEVFRRNTGHDYHDLIDIAPTIVEADKGEEYE